MMIHRFYKLYVYANILISLLTGVLLKYNIKPLGITPSIVYAAIFIIFSICVIIVNIDRIVIRKFLGFSIIYFNLSLILFFLLYGSISIVEETNYVWNFLLAIVIIYFASNYLDSEVFKRAIEFNNIVLILNILISGLLDIGYPSYESGGVAIGTKGFLSGGNTASVLIIATFVYYLFKKEKNKVTYLLLIATFVAGMLVQTIALIAIPLILFGYLFLKYWRTALIASALIISFFVPQVISGVSELNLYRLNRSNSGENTNLVLSLISSSRRIVDSSKQFEYQLEHPITLINGIGRSGQILFWKRDDFDFSGTDISDIIFRYGIIGFGIYTIAFIVPVWRAKKLGISDEYVYPPLIIILYGLIGGYVSTSITTLVYLAMYIGLYRKHENSSSDK